MRYIIILFLLFSFCNFEQGKNVEIKVGQIWILESENPFIESMEFYVIEIQGDYAKYCQLKYKDNKKRWLYEYSLSKKSFKFIARLKENSKKGR